MYPLMDALAAYAAGSLSFAVIVTRLMGLNDPRTYGSKNPGATNVLRSGSKAAAIVTLLLDALKGWLPLLLVKLYGPTYGLEEGTQALVALAAFLGHLYPVFFRFVGGKGVATALGVIVGISPLLGLSVLAASDARSDGAGHWGARSLPATRPPAAEVAQVGRGEADTRTKHREETPRGVLGVVAAKVGQQELDVGAREPQLR